MPARPPVDYVALPLPSNLPDAVAPAYRNLMQALNDRAALEQRLNALQAEIKAHRDQVLDAVCPVPEGGDLPLDRNVLVDVDQRHLTITEDPNAQDGRMVMHWSVEGRRLSFKDGVMTEGRSVTVDQSTYDALPDEVKAQTRLSIREATPLAANLRRPLTWTEPVASMFQHVKEVFHGTESDAAVRLPSAMWDNDSATRRIYLNMVKQGVLELAASPKGVMTEPSALLTSWYVQRGPRYDEFANTLAEEQARQRAAHTAVRHRRPR